VHTRNIENIEYKKTDHKVNCNDEIKENCGIEFESTKQSPYTMILQSQSFHFNSNNSEKKNKIDEDIIYKGSLQQIIQPQQQCKEL
jgi:hypothetical protein